MFLIGFRLGLNAFDATVIDVGYAGTVGADRRAARPAAVRQLPGLERCALRRASTATAPRAPTARPRRTIAASRRSRTATPTGRSTTPPTCRRSRSPAGPGAGTTCRRRTAPRPSSTWPARRAWRPSGWRFGRMRMALLCALAWLAYPVHGLRAAGEHERHDRRGVRDLGLRVRGLADTARRRCSRSRPGRSSRRSCSGRSGAATRAATPAPPRSFLRGVAGLALGTALAGLLLLPGGFDGAADCSGIARPASSWAARRRSRSGTGTSTSRLPRSRRLQTALEAVLVTCAALLAFRPRTARRRPARRALGRARAGLRARAHALVVPLPAVGVPVRPARARPALAAVVTVDGVHIPQGGSVC